jgi:hypothetical protein
MGRCFWVGCGWFFLGGGGGGEKTSGYVQQGQFSSGRRVLSNSPIFMLYIIYGAVGVAPIHTSDHRERCPRSSMTCQWTDTYSVEVSTT